MSKNWIRDNVDRRRTDTIVAAKLIIFAILLFSSLKDISAQSVGSRQSIPKFMGRQVTIAEPEKLDPDGFFPKGPASICVEGPPQRQCYTAPQEFGNSPAVTVVQLQKYLPALLFSAATGGVSGWEIHFALLRPGKGKDLQDLLMSDVSISNQGQYVFWSDPSISDAQIFVTAKYVSGPDEGHYGEHRYIISAYVQEPSSMVDDRYYYLEDQYMTVRKYDLETNAHILDAEKPEIFARLRRLKATTRSQPQAPPLESPLDQR
jgi:hypothetical protein